LAARFVGRIDNRPWFRDIFASHEKRFHHAKNCFTWSFGRNRILKSVMISVVPLTYDKTHTPPQRFDRRQEINIDGSSNIVEPGLLAAPEQAR
jgi:hypothetical protein